MTLQYRIGDVFDRLADIPDNSIDLIVTSPPFLALRSYLPADHEHKHREIGSEATPAEFIDTLLELTAEWGRVLAPHGSLCVELGDTYAGGNGFPIPDPKSPHRDDQDLTVRGRKPSGGGWPLAKSLTGIPTLYPWSLAYGRNLLTGAESPAGPWRIRNMIVWGRPNPPVGALGDKFRPATSYITVACRSPRRYFDLDAVRVPGSSFDRPEGERKGRSIHGQAEGWTNNATLTHHPAGAPPLDWHADDHPADGDWLWKLPTQPYKGSHYATYPLALPKKLIEAMCPLRVCTTCGKPSERIVGDTDEYAAYKADNRWESGGLVTSNLNRPNIDFSMQRTTTLGWTDCGHDAWRTGIVLDPFAGSGTTLDAAQAVGRHAIGIDLDERNAELAQQRVGMFLEVQP
jgi:DNA modification methylase